MSTAAVLEEILKNPNLPTPPGVALQVLEQASRPECSIDDLTKLITLDPGLSAKILKTVNSAVFGLSRSITSIQRALAIIGLSSARSLTLSLSLPEMHRGVPQDDFMRDYWKQSLAGSIVMRELSKKLRRRDPEDDMVAGLLRDVGMLVLRQSYPDAYAKVLARPATELAMHLPEWERHYCGIDHAEVSAMLLKRWRFPDEFVEAVRVHHDPRAGQFSGSFFADRAYMLQFSSYISQIQVTPDSPLVHSKIAEESHTRFNMDDTQLAEFLDPLKGKIEEFAGILKVDIGRCHTFSQVLAKASEELVNLTLAVNMDNQRVQEQKKEAESEAKRWREEAIFDPLTKAFNRRFLERQLDELFQNSFDKGFGVGMLFIDLDGFKPLNDKFGHQFGDQVLCDVAYTLRRQVRQGDYVARFGGDEFCVLIQKTDEQGLRCLANRIWQSVQDLTIRQGSNEGKVGASIGAIVCNPGEAGMCPDVILSSSDKAMYAAKRQGKNRVVFYTELKEQPGLVAG